MDVPEQLSRDAFGMVTELLQYHGFSHTLHALAAERKAKRRQVASSVTGKPLEGRERRTACQALLRAFDEGRRDDFFAAWQHCVPAQLLSSDPSTRQAEFRLHVYFALFPVLPLPHHAAGSGTAANSVASSAASSSFAAGQLTGSSGSRQELAQRMRAFKQYLETQGAGMARDPAYLPLFALPYVPRPEGHPSFSYMFTPEWAPQQREGLRDFLDSLVPNGEEVQGLPRIYLALIQGTATDSGSSNRSMSAAAAVAHTGSRRAAGPGATAKGAAAATAAPTAAQGVLLVGSRPVSALLRGEQGLADVIKASSVRPAAAQGVALSEAAAGAEAPIDAHVLPQSPNGAAELPHSASDAAATSENGGDMRASYRDADWEADSASERGEEPGVAEQGDSSAAGEAASVANDSAASLQDCPQQPAQPSAGGTGSSTGALADELQQQAPHDTQQQQQRGRQPLPPYEPGSLQPLQYAALRRDLAAAADAAPRSSSGHASAGGAAPATARLLEALRWRLTRQPAGLEQFIELTAWMEGDLLGVTSPTGLAGAAAHGSTHLHHHHKDTSGMAVPMLEGLVRLSDHEVTTELARLLNATTSTRGGRAYLTQQPRIAVGVLLHILRSGANRQLCYGPLIGDAASGGCGSRSEGGGSSGEGSSEGRDSVLQQQALAALQKLSLKRCAQSAMLPAGGLEWVVEFLCGAAPGLYSSSGAVSTATLNPSTDAAAGSGAGTAANTADACAELSDVTVPSVTAALQQLSEYSLEYGAALLMNLALRSGGKARVGAEAAAGLRHALLVLCEALLESPNEQVRTYINGTLYSVLAHPRARAAAHSAGLAQLLRAVGARSSPPFSKQVEYVQQQLGSPPAAAPAAALQQEAGGEGDDGTGRGADTLSSAEPAEGEEELTAAEVQEALSDDEEGEDGDAYMDDEEAELEEELGQAPDAEAAGGEVAALRGEELLQAHYSAGLQGRADAALLRASLASNLTSIGAHPSALQLGAEQSSVLRGSYAGPFSPSAAAGTSSVGKLQAGPLLRPTTPGGHGAVRASGAWSTLQQQQSSSSSIYGAASGGGAGGWRAPGVAGGGVRESLVAKAEVEAARLRSKLASALAGEAQGAAAPAATAQEYIQAFSASARLTRSPRPGLGRY